MTAFEHMHLLHRSLVLLCVAHLCATILISSDVTPPTVVKSGANAAQAHNNISDYLKLECHGDTPYGNRKRELRKFARYRAEDLEPMCGNWRDKSLSSQPSSEFQPLDSFWESLAGDFPLTADSLRRAATPLGYKGARGRFEEAALKLLRSTDPAAAPFRIVVMGGSMTHGHQTLHAWPDLLFKYLQRAGFNVALRNAARSATMSDIHRELSSIHPDIYAADLILVDYDVNDIYFQQDMLRPQIQLPNHHDHERLLRLLIDLPQRPAVVDVETFHQLWDNFGPNHTKAALHFWEDSRTTSACLERLTQFVHYEATYLLVPLISLSEAVCHTGRTWWIPQGKLDDATENGPAHPGAITHDLVARTVIGALLLEADDVCEHRGPRGDDYPAPSDVVPESEEAALQCLQHPWTFKVGGAGVLAKNVQWHPDVAVRDRVIPLAKAASSTNPQKSWHYGVDVKGKPGGWLATVGAPSGVIEFPVRTYAGWIQIEFLKTYENIGSIKCWTEYHDLSSNACDIDGQWASHVSMPGFYYMKTKLGPGVHQLRCKSDGRKFKITSIIAC